MSKEYFTETLGELTAKVRAFDELAGVEAMVPDSRFPEVAQRIIDHAQEGLDAGDLFESNIEPTEDRARNFASMLEQLKRNGAITLDADTSPVLKEACRMIEDNLSDRLGKDVIAHRLGYNDAEIAQMRESLEVLKPLSEAVSDRRNRAQFHRQHRAPERGRGRSL